MQSCPPNNNNVPVKPVAELQWAKQYGCCHMPPLSSTASKADKDAYAHARNYCLQAQHCKDFTIHPVGSCQTKASTSLAGSRGTSHRAIDGTQASLGDLILHMMYIR